MRFRSCFRSAPGTRTRARDPFGFKLSVDVSRDFSLDPSPESSSKDSRKLFNPHLLSQTRTDVSVQFSRNRRRPAAGRRILAEALFSVKRKVKPRFTFPRLASKRQETSRNGGKRQRARKNTPHAASAGDRNIGPDPLRVKGIALGTGQRMHRGSRNRSVPARTGRKARRGRPRFPAQTEPLREKTSLKRTRPRQTTRLKLLKRDAFGARGLPTAAITPPSFKS